MMSNVISRMRLTGWIEGASLLVLVGIAVPLKYFADLPMAVRVVGPFHGFFFAIYCLLLADVWQRYSWSVKKTLTFFVAALIPFGVFVVDRRLNESPH